MGIEILFSKFPKIWNTVTKFLFYREIDDREMKNKNNERCTLLGLSSRTKYFNTQQISSGVKMIQSCWPRVNPGFLEVRVSRISIITFFSWNYSAMGRKED